MEQTMKTFDMRILVAAVASTVLAMGAAHAQTSQGTTSQGTPSQGATSQGAGQSGGMGKGTEMGKGGQMAVPGSPNAARSGMWDADLFTRLDTNKDGKISRDEAQAEPIVRDAWSQLDATNAGSVSRSDFDRFGQARSNGGTGMGSTATSGASGSTNPSSSTKK
jgi:hypothetical protein